MNQPKRFPLAFLPTPLEYVKKLSDHFGGPNIFIKRDDLTGLAFGGNKSTGWGRHAGSDSWKQYVRRASITLNHNKEDKVELAQGVSF